MRYLILSDIHANWEALEAVLADAGGAYDQILCCGDLVGYCADPNLVIEWCRQKAAVVVRGNHDKACAGLDDIEWFNPVARSAVLWTQRVLTPANLEYLRNLPKGPVELNGFQILHGSPVDEDEYLVSTGDVSQITPYLTRSLSFFGHTHLQGGFLWERGGLRRIGKIPLDADHQLVDLPDGVTCLANPGAVGQPRDGDPRAAYLLYAPEERVLHYRRVAYDIAKAQAKILKNSLDETLASRLAAGL